MRYIRHYNKAPKIVKWKYGDPSRRIGPQLNVTGHSYCNIIMKNINPMCQTSLDNLLSVFSTVFSHITLR